MGKLRPKVVSIIGARPQFIKAAPVSRVLRKKAKEILVHTGQHYDENMSETFFRELHIPEPDYNLGVGSGSHARQTALMMERIEKVLLAEKPDFVLVYGDTNSTLAGALATVKLHIPLGHVEAGLRSFNKKMPEEVNRIVADHCADLLFCPTETATKNLKSEGIFKGVFLTGDVMYDMALQCAQLAEKRSNILKKLGVQSKSYVLCTVHRAENTDHTGNLREIVEALVHCGYPVVFPVHPRTRRALSHYGLWTLLKECPHIYLLDPVGYLDMIILEKHAFVIFTDSGGVQKEAYFYGIPCITLRNETEWIETVKEGWNILSGANTKRILYALDHINITSKSRLGYGDGRSAEKIVEKVLNFF